MPKTKQKKGFVSLVGAGPGDPKLLTLKAKEALRSCDVLVYDYLVHPSILKHAPQAEAFYVGKKGGDPDSASQKSIETLLLKLARKGKQVVRLKGGDPFVFGRGGEEALFLSKNKIPFEVVPGITAGIAGPAYAGISITHRGLASDVTFITAHEDLRQTAQRDLSTKRCSDGPRRALWRAAKTESSLNWKALAGLTGTLVIYMGVKTLPNVIHELIKYGKKPNTPVSVIRWATTSEQKTVTGILSNIVKKVEEAGLKPPAITVIGEVNQLRNQLKWFEEKPLFGKRVLITRSRKQASQLRESLESEGASVLEVPTIEIAPISDFALVDKAAEELGLYDWLVFTSENGVEAFFDRLRTLKKDSRVLKGLKVAAIGPGTKAKLNRFFIEPDLVPETFTTEGLIAALKKAGIRGKRFLLLRTNIAPDLLNRTLAEAGGKVTEISIYKTEKPKDLSKKVKAAMYDNPIDFVTFTSSSTAEHFFEALGNARQTMRRGPSESVADGSVDALWRSKKLPAKVISIGPVTSEAIRKFGVKVTREAKKSTIPGLVEAVIEEAR